MSSFTLFDGTTSVVYDKEASDALGKDYWRVTNGFRYYIGALDSSRWVDIPTGYLTDGASVFFPINAIIPAWGSYGQAVILHDYLCEHYLYTRIRDGIMSVEAIDRKEIDEILSDSMKILGVKKWQHFLIMAGVNLYRIIANPTRPSVDILKKNLERRKFP